MNRYPDRDYQESDALEWSGPGTECKKTEYRQDINHPHQFGPGQGMGQIEDNHIETGSMSPGIVKWLPSEEGAQTEKGAEVKAE